MAEISDITISHATALDIKDDNLVAELLGTCLLMFAGSAAMVVNKNMNILGIAVFRGLDVMVMIYTVGQVPGAHFNPAVTIAFATSYASAHVAGATLATGTVRLMFQEEQPQFLGTIPAGSDLQSLGLEFLITLYLMLAVAGIAVNNRHVGELTGLVIGA
ncbi:aquaporin NIP1-1-like [Lycium barbarum]|uniref:aquaporin NIP1-1-like n=1 Tax=Lycium barbarum TaxID=112863 RepID=UPI00293E0348|nr:aquaporin NIP1-1-like [Lycium barbarum]